MSTKINVRSPFYLHLTEPTVPLPTYDCTTANLIGFSVDNQGVVTLPNADYGIVHSYTSTAGDFADGKFATVSSDTVRTIDVTIRIPSGFTNTEDVYFECGTSATQAGLSTPTACTPEITLNGSISSQSLNSGGNSVDIDLSNYFTQGAYPISGYNITNSNPVLVSTAISGSILTITSNVIGGSTTLYASAYDSGTNTCTAVQAISVTINVVGAPTYNCNTSPLTGGAIAADGTVTNPQTTGTITGYTPTTTANNTGSARDVTLTFSITVPSGYANAGATITCDKTFSQPSVGIDPLFTCIIAGLTKQAISERGSIYIGVASKGTLGDFTPSSFSPVSVDTARTVSFDVLVPSGYSNAGSTIVCSKDLIQPAEIDDCGANTFYLSTAKTSVNNFCDNTYTTTSTIQSTGITVTELMGTKICKNGTPFNGKGYYYGVSTSSTNSVGVGVGDFYLIKIDTTGIVLDVQIRNCASGGDGKGAIL